MSDTNATIEPTETTKSPLLSGATYDRIKFIVQYVLPAAATLYAGLAVLWGFPYGTEVVGTIGLITVFLSAILGISNVSYNKSDAKYDGALVLSSVYPGENKASFEVDLPATELVTKDSITLKVLPQSELH
jgi:hypothetical protein